MGPHEITLEGTLWDNGKLALRARQAAQAAQVLQHQQQFAYSDVSTQGLLALQTGYAPRHQQQPESRRLLVFHGSWKRRIHRSRNRDNRNNRNNSSHRVKIFAMSTVVTTSRQLLKGLPNMLKGSTINVKLLSIAKPVTTIPSHVKD